MGIPGKSLSRVSAPIRVRKVRYRFLPLALARLSVPVHLRGPRAHVIPIQRIAA